MFEIGQVFRRRDLHETYGGQSQGGISTPARHAVIFLFTGESGHQYGYQDTWLDADHFDYVGEGQRGDMQMHKGNAAILNHAASGKALHLFEDAGHGHIRYVGEMSCIDYYTREMSDVDGRPRQGLVFRLTRTFFEEESVLAVVEELEGETRRRGQGFRLSPAARRALEEYAMRRAHDHFEAGGWQVVDVHHNRPFDFLCTKGDEELRVEVKGTTTAGAEVLLTKNEVDHAKVRFPQTCLFVVANIELTEDEGKFTAAGGTARSMLPWRIEDGELQPIVYGYKLPEP